MSVRKTSLEVVCISHTRTPVDIGWGKGLCRGPQARIFASTHRLLKLLQQELTLVVSNFSL